MTSLPTEATVVPLLNEKGEICLARKKQAIHKDGEAITYSLSMYNGYGGKKEDGDISIFDTAVRELFQESGVVARKEDLIETLTVHFFIDNQSGERALFMVVSFFMLTTFSGTPKESDEMGPPIFFSKDALPYNEMMPADKILFQKIIKGEKAEYSVVLQGKGKDPIVTLLA